VAPRGVAQGALVQHRLVQRVLGNSRDVWTYVPAGGQAPEALLVLFDGNAYAHRCPRPPSSTTSWPTA
jgi:enterochelin esterase family protein